MLNGISNFFYKNAYRIKHLERLWDYETLKSQSPIVSRTFFVNVHLYCLCVFCERYQNFWIIFGNFGQIKKILFHFSCLYKNLHREKWDFSEFSQFLCHFFALHFLHFLHFPLQSAVVQIVQCDFFIFAIHLPNAMGQEVKQISFIIRYIILFLFRLALPHIRQAFFLCPPFDHLYLFLQKLKQKRYKLQHRLDFA